MRNFDLQDPEVIEYPSHPQAKVPESAKHFNLILFLYQGLHDLFKGKLDEVSIHADMCWYPLKDNTLWKSPDLFVVFGVPHDNERVSYAQVNHGDISPQVIFEMGSVANTQQEIYDKRQWYSDYGVEEYYWITEAQDKVHVFVRKGNKLVEQEPEDLTWKSKRLEITFDWSSEQVKILLPNGKPMLSKEEREEQLLKEKRKEIKRRKEDEKRAEQEAQRAEQEAQRAEQEAQRAEQEASARRKLEAELAALRKQYGLGDSTK